MKGFNVSFFKRSFISSLVILIFSINLSFTKEALPSDIQGSSIVKEDKSTSEMFIVVIDPGHGGDNDGAVGPTGLKEKDITLKISEMLKEFIKERSGAKVILTREKDEFPSIDERTYVANNNESDIFISIHTDADFDPKKKGFAVFYFDPDYRNINPRLLKKKDKDIILWDNVQLKFVNKSRILAEAIKKSIDEQDFSENTWIKKAPLSILKGARMPAIMITVGYISNPEEEMRLKDVVYLTRIAEAIYKGLERYRERDKEDETPKG